VEAREKRTVLFLGNGCVDVIGRFSLGDLNAEMPYDWAGDSRQKMHPALYVYVRLPSPRQSTSELANWFREL
jgi:hypothetical protein